MSKGGCESIKLKDMNRAQGTSAPQAHSSSAITSIGGGVVVWSLYVDVFR